MRPRALLAAVLALAPALSATACSRGLTIDPSGSLAPGAHEIAIEHDGRTRRAVVYVPERAAAGVPSPLVIAFHGGGGEAEGFRSYAGLDAVADREGLVVVYPYGTGVLPRRLLTWNAARACCGYALDNRVDDVGFAVALIDHVAAHTPVDRRRVYATGHSNGSMMAYRLAAERAERIAAVVGVAGAMDLEPFAPSRAVPVLHIHSVDDPRALFEGGLGPPFPLTDRRVHHAPVMDGVQRWSRHNGCAEGTLAQSEARTGAPGTVDAEQTAVRLVAPSCPSQATVELWRLTGSGHGWPGRVNGGLVAALIGPPTTLLDAAEEAWAFFRRFEAPR